MGLDMYARKTKARLPGVVDFDTDQIESEEIFYWRKHPNLHGWMEHLYRKKGGAAESFNVTPVQLTMDDLTALRDAIEGRALPDTAGFFFGQSFNNDQERAEDLQFIEKAIMAIGEGHAVYYTSWW